MKYLYTLTLLVLFSIGHAQEIKINKGDLEINLAANVDRAEIDAGLHFGAFVADYTQGRFDVGYVDTDFYTQTLIGITGLRFFETRTYTLPYVGLGLGYTAVDGGGQVDNSGIEFSFIAGVRYYLTESLALNTELKSAWSTDQTYIDGDKVVDSNFSLGISLSYLW